MSSIERGRGCIGSSGFPDLERAIGGDQDVDPQIEFLARVFDVSGDDSQC